LIIGRVLHLGSNIARLEAKGQESSDSVSQALLAVRPDQYKSLRSVFLDILKMLNIAASSRVPYLHIDFVMPREFLQRLD
jgi:hypothetical protein